MVLGCEDRSAPSTLARKGSRPPPNPTENELKGPLFEDRPAWLRYGIAVSLVIVVAAARFAVIPLAGVQTPLLPFVAAVYFAVWLAGFWPAVLATLLSPIVASLLFAQLSGFADTLAWFSHVLLFLAVGFVISWVSRRLQLASDAALTSEARLQLALTGLSVALRAGGAGSFERDITKNISVWSAELQELFGFRPGEFGGKHEDWIECIEPEDRELISQSEERALQTGEVTAEYRIRRHDTGEVRWVHGRGRVSFGNDGQPGRMTGVCVDITELKRTEGALRASEERLRLVTDHIPALISYVDRSERFQFINAACADWFGSAGATVTGKLIRDLLGESTYRQREPYLRAVLRGEFVRFQGELSHRSLGLRECEITYVPDIADNGDVRGFYVMVQDFTERVAAERALRIADRRKDEFLAMLAHELRNPIAPIRNVATLLATGTVEAADVRRIGELLVRQTSQLVHLVDDLLDVARITRGMVELKAETLSLVGLVDGALEAVQPLAATKRQTIMHDSPATALLVRGDAVRLRQVFENLLSNAVKFSPSLATTRVRYLRVDDTARVHILDAGVGIEATVLPHVFELFMQADRSLDRTQGGLGIGLTIVKHLVELHGGSVEAHSDGVGKGTEIIVSLPLAAPAVAAAGITSDGQDTRTDRRSILIVEDNVDSAETLALVLAAAGHDVRTVHDGAAALETLATYAADLVLLDIGLPGMDGYTVAREIRGRFTDRGTRLYALTGYGREEDRTLARNAGFDLHLTKPIDPQRLLALI